MSEGNSGVSPQDNPPSFIPSGTRKRRPSGQVPPLLGSVIGIDAD